jgi:hypothetical protein
MIGIEFEVLIGSDDVEFATNTFLKCFASASRVLVDPRFFVVALFPNEIHPLAC